MKNERFELKNFISSLKARINSNILAFAVGSVLLVLMPLILGYRLEMLNIQVSILVDNGIGWNLAIMYFLELVLVLCCGSLPVAGMLSTLLFTILYSVNDYVYAFRGAPLTLNEAMAAGTAAKVLGNYDFTPRRELAVCWLIAALFVLAFLSVRHWSKKVGVIGKSAESADNRKVGGKPGRRIRLRKRLVGFSAGLLLLLFGGYALLFTEMLQSHGFRLLYGYHANDIYRSYGFLVSTCLDIGNSRMVPPEGYSVDRVEEILRETAEKTESLGDVNSDTNGVGAGKTEDLPHIILIMNESFADLSVLGDIELSEENLPFFNSLTENTVSGYVNASVIGGGTSNSEFEVFTGCTMGFFPSSYYAYLRCVDRPSNTLISNMEANGYRTYSMHPETAKNWNRDKVYEYFGFDESLWAEDFESAPVYHSGVSDGATYQKVIELYEGRGEGEKLFLFDLTMQNHGGYIMWAEEQSQIHVEALNVDDAEMDEYLTLIKASDEDFEKLIHYFSEEEEKVVVCMFGDHQPKFSNDEVYEILEGEDKSEIERVMNRYKTPFVIWANYDIEQQRDMDISLNYLGVLLMDVVGLEMSDYFSFLKEQMQEYPIITVNGYVDGNGAIHEWSGEKNEMPEYRMLQYNYLFDKNRVDWGF